jgi:hypothetical protein
VCTAARSEICDRRQRGIHERRRSAMTSKRTSLLRPTDARAAWSATAGGENSARSGDPRRGAGMPPGRQAVVAPPPARHADDVAPARDRRRARGARAAPGRADQSLLASPSTSRKRRWQCNQVTAAVRVPRGRDRRGAGAASPTADAAKRRSVAARCSRKILPCAPAAQFIPSLRTRPRSNYACVWGSEGNEAFIVGDYRGEYWR